MNDSDSYKKRVSAALEKFHQKDLKEINKLMGRGKRNKAPEKDVERACCKWLKENGFVGEVYESKATFDPKRGIYRQQSLKSGHTDWGGVDPEGLAVYVEFKAPGKLSTFYKDSNMAQRDFINARINQNAFAVVVDDLEKLISAYNEWKRCRAISMDMARQFLFRILPKRKKPVVATQNSNSDDDLPF